jgi:hypothetical protein
MAAAAGTAAAAAAAAKTLIALAIVTVVVAAFLGVAYATATDFAACNHKAFISETLARRNPRALVSQRPTRCLGHSPDPLDVASLQTGDVLSVSYRGIRSVFSAATYRSVWTHPALIVRDTATGEPFVFEAAAYRPPFCGGFIRIPLLNWVRINRNSRSIALTPINKPASAALISAAFERFERSNIGVESLRPEWVRFLRRKNRDDLPTDSFFAPPLARTKPAKRVVSEYNPIKEAARTAGILRQPAPEDSFEHVLTCHEVLIELLQAAGAVDPDVSPCSFLPTVFTSARDQLPMASGYAFGEPKPVSIAWLVDVARAEGGFS